MIPSTLLKPVNGEDFFTGGYHSKTISYLTEIEKGDFIKVVNKNKTNQLVVDLETAGLLTALEALYPLQTGSNSWSHSFNLIDVTKYRLNYVKSPKHTDQGIIFSGVNWAVVSDFEPSTVLTKNNYSIITYFNGMTPVIEGLNPLHGVLWNGESVFFGSTPTGAKASIGAQLTTTFTQRDKVILAATRGSTTAKLFIDGEKKDEETGLSSDSPLTQHEVYLGGLHINQTPSLEHYYTGGIGLWAAFKRELTEAEVLSINTIFRKYLNI